MSTATINILCTGGTIDMVYSGGSAIGEPNFSFPEISSVSSLVNRLLLQKLVTVHYDKKKAKDSVDMNQEDRERIADWCVSKKAHPVVIVHGTDTMVRTAEKIASINPSNAVVITGALTPARDRDSDAEFNLGGAIAAAQVCSPGVYIFMSGIVFPWNKCYKHRQAQRFEWK